MDTETLKTIKDMPETESVSIPQSELVLADEKPKAYVLYDPMPHIKTIDTADMRMDQIDKMVVQIEPYHLKSIPSLRDAMANIQPEALEFIKKINNKTYKEFFAEIAQYWQLIDKKVLVSQIVLLFEDHIYITLGAGTPNAKISLQELLSLLFFGNDEIIFLCKKLSIDVKTFLHELRKSTKINSIIDLDLFEKFLDFRYGAVSYSASIIYPPVQRIISSYDRTKGLIDIVNMKQSPIINSDFKAKLKLLLNDNPYHNIMAFESMLFSTIISMPDFKYYNLAYTDMIKAINYINRIKSIKFTTADECFKYYTEFFKQTEYSIVHNIYKKESTITIIQSNDTSYYIVDDRIPDVVNRFRYDEPVRTIRDIDIHNDNDINNNVENMIETDDLDEEIDEYVDNVRMQAEEHHQVLEQQMDIEIKILSLIKSISNIPDTFGISSKLIFNISKFDKNFVKLSNNLTDMMVMSDVLPDQWCEVDTCIDINNKLKIKYNTFMDYHHTTCGKQLLFKLNQCGQIDREHIQLLYSGNSEIYKNMATYESEIYKNKDFIVNILKIEDIYQNISHEFIKYVMKEYNVPNYIMNYVNNLLAKLKIRFLINGEYTNYIRVEKGLLHYDHLFEPLIFMCIQYIINILNNKYKKHKPNDIQIMNIWFNESIITYATDPRAIKAIIEEVIKINHHLGTGLNINYNKSSFISNRKLDYIIIRDIENEKKIIKRLNNSELIDQIIDNTISDFLIADDEIKKRNLNQQIIEKIYQIIVSNVEKKVSVLITNLDQMLKLVKKLDNTIKYYTIMWKIKSKEIIKYDCEDLNIISIIQIVENESDPMFKNHINSIVASIYQSSF